MKYTLQITPLASQDVLEIYEYISVDSKQNAQKQMNLIRNTLEKLADFPNLGGELSKKYKIETDYRYLIIDKLYIAFYKIINGSVIIYRILSGRQDYVKILEIEKDK